MATRPNTSSSSSRPYTAGGDRPTTSSGWTDSEPPSTAHGPTSYAYPAQYYQTQQGQLYAQEEDEEEDDSDAEGVFAYLPPGTPATPQSQTTQTSNTLPHQQNPNSDPGHHSLSPAQLHNLVAAAGLNGQHQSPGTLATIAEHTPQNSHYPKAADSYELESYATKDIPVSPGSAMSAYDQSSGYVPQPIPMSARTPDSHAREVRVTLPTSGHSYNSSYGPQSPGTKRVSSEHENSVIDMGTTMSYKYTDMEAAEDEEDSPYAEVRASVSNMDDPEMPALTFRMWFCGILLCFIGVCLNTFFNFRYPAPMLVPIVILLLAHPMGKACAYFLPIKTFRLPAFLGGGSFTFNPGPFNVKEHVLIYMMANVSVAPAYAMNAIVVSELYYGLDFGPGFGILLLLATQCTGFGLCGICRRFLVWPASMIWPQNLVSCTLLNTLHAEDDADSSSGITRYRFFLYVLGGAFLWSFFPSFIFVGLSMFSWVCWIAPNNLVVNQLFGTASGLGMGFLTFDWAQISYIGSPLMIPWWAQVHVFAGFVLFYWFILPILYHSNVWFLAHMPMLGRGTYDRFGQRFDVSMVLDETGHRLDPAKYAEYSALYLPGSYAMVYLLAFALSTALITHTILYHGKSLMNGLKRIKVEEEDIHAKLMKAYPEVPDYWYATVCVVFFIMAVVAIEVWPTNMPVWSLALAILLPAVYVLPCGFIWAVTAQGVSINLVAEILPGALLPGRPLPNMIFKAYAVQTIAATMIFTQDLKLGHYIKVPPRASFLAQATAAVMGSLLQVGVKEWLFANIPDMCSETQKNFLICPQNRVFFSASAVWGLIGPTRQFGGGTLYNTHLWALLIGALLPIPFWVWQRKNPNTRFKYINIPVFLNGPTFIPPATGINYSSWFITGFVFQYLARKRHFRWWSKFNYILSAGLDSGTIIGMLVIFLSFALPNGGMGVQLPWWGNEVTFKTLDGTFPPPPKIMLPLGEPFDGPPKVV